MKLASKRGFIMKKFITTKGVIDADGGCKGEPRRISQILNKAVVFKEYSTELRQWEGVLDDVTGKMQTR